MSTQRRYTIVSLGLFVALAFVSSRAWATPLSFSQSLITKTSGSLEDNGTSSSAVSDGQNSAASFNTLGSSIMGASVSSDGSAFSVSTQTEHLDDWFCTSCNAASLALTETISFDAIISAAQPGEFSLTANYILAGQQFSFAAGSDSSPITASASFGAVDIPVVIGTDPVTGNITLSAIFTTGLNVLTSCNNTVGPCEVFSDSQGISLEMEGSGFVDASHTFSVTLTPTDPSIVLTSADGRTAGTVNAVPEPATLTLAGLGFAAAVAGSQRRRSRSAS